MNNNPSPGSPGLHNPHVATENNHRVISRRKLRNSFANCHMYSVIDF